MTQYQTTTTLCDRCDSEVVPVLDRAGEEAGNPGGFILLSCGPQRDYDPLVTTDICDPCLAALEEWWAAGKPTGRKAVPAEETTP